MRYLYLLLVYLLAISCQVAGRQKAFTLGNKFNDSTIRIIYTAQDERQTDKLLPFLTDTNARYRQEAAMALASVQDSLAFKPLVSLLSDPEFVVRQAAAYALGQTGKATSQETILQAIEKEENNTVSAELLEALGKCATQQGLDALIKFDFSEPEVQAGQAWGIYRTHARQLNYDSAILKMVTFLTAPNPEIRLAAAHFLARTPQLDLSAYTAALANTAQIDPSVEVRMAAAQALTKAKSPGLANELTGILETEPDYRVRLSALRATANLEYTVAKPILWRGLADKNSNTALTAAEIIATKVTPDQADELLQKAGQTLRWRIRATLLGAALKQHPNKKEVLTTIQERYAQSNNDYEKAALLTAAAQDIAGAEFIEKEFFATQTPVIRTYGIEALTQIRNDKNLPTSQKKHFADLFKKAIASGDLAVVGITAGLLRQPELNFKTEYTDLTFLKNALAKLVLPRDNEAYQEVVKTIAFLEGHPEPPPPKNPFSHPIDWILIQSLRAKQEVSIQTNRGEIILQLFVEEAPGTVANFVQLARSGFFNGKNFHRVVPNFVVQGGDPRGDGWGGTDYSIRSELPDLHYREGYLGMASAGKDTESCQWFITHSPTPHLDGRYSIFARATTGLEVLPLLEIGDKIQEVRLR
ncbi:peptidylprolyl isomerase [Adhaeribacter pallidiroseus]|uniref:peptidylprolyl isomerase n=1 Tax=Adhaeribacter pallidiroseus TaxID=2072847 RepID=A0A369QKA7_9BACT|nr:peptidylprolyl isomerase [Adhaeribacter pallidiroseus]RDC64822.1 Peptidylprolyl isomerase [Adhaeribacter pallidiroseus]